MALLAKARKYERGFPGSSSTRCLVQYQELGADYIYAILTGYTRSSGSNWNLYFPGHKIAMPQPPIADGAVEYTDGSRPRWQLRQGRDRLPLLGGEARRLAERKKIGLRVMIFLIVFAVLLYFTKKKVWSKIH